MEIVSFSLMIALNLTILGYSPVVSYWAQIQILVVLYVIPFICLLTCFTFFTRLFKAKLPGSRSNQWKNIHREQMIYIPRTLG
jgi:hypothetical protein